MIKPIAGMKEIGNDDLVYKILQSSDFGKETNQQIKALFEQLNASITQIEADTIAATDETVVVGCWHNDKIVGMASMATYKVISGHKGMIEDVVVNKDYRGKGIGKKLMQRLLDEAQRLQLDEILLFSGHHRQAAISLYKSLGFTLKDSGLYRLQFN